MQKDVAEFRPHDSADDTRLREVVRLARSEGFVVALADDAVELGSSVAQLLRSAPLGAFEEAVLTRIDRGLPPARAAEQMGCAYGVIGPVGERARASLGDDLCLVGDSEAAGRGLTWAESRKRPGQVRVQADVDPSEVM